MSRVISFVFIIAIVCVCDMMAEDVSVSIQDIDTSIINVEQTQLLLDFSEQQLGQNSSLGLQYASLAHSNSLRLENLELQAQSSFLIGRFSMDIGLLSSSLEQYNEALSLFVELGDQINYLRVIKHLGDLYFQSREFKRALKFYDECIESAEILKDTSLLLQGLIGKGAVFGNISKLDSALYIFNQTYSLAKEFGDEDLAAHSYFNIADVHLWSGRAHLALEKYYELDRANNSNVIGTRSKTGLFNSITRANIFLGNVREARKYNLLAREQMKDYYRLTDMIVFLEYSFMLDTLVGDYKLAVDHLSEFKNLSDSLLQSEFQQRLAGFETLYKYELQERKIEELLLDNEVKDLEIRQRTIVIYGSIVLLMLLLFLIVQFIIGSRRAKIQYKLLQEQKYDLEAASEEIRAQSEDLFNKNTKLESVISELKRTQQQVVQSEKMASLGVLTAGVAHEINNPLNFISGGVDILLQMEKEIPKDQLNPEFKDQFSELTSIISQGLDRVTKIVKALNTFSRLDSGKKSFVYINDILENTLLFLNSKLKHNIRVIKDYNFTDAVLVYPEKLHQLFLNIIDNAIYAVNQKEEGDKVIRISTSSIAHIYRIVISNNGANIPEEILNLVFDPFYTTKEPGEGTGLGLSICFTIVQEHNGIMLAENTEEGVRFVIEFPNQELLNKGE